MTNDYILQILAVAVVAMIVGSILAKPRSWKHGVGQFIVIVISLVALSFFILQTGAYGWMDGALLGFFAWLGFIFPRDMVSLISEGRETKLVFIGTGAGLVTFAISGAILAAWMA
ncbi:MAG: DUF1761 domain-containing protein [bacterium]|nr:DUF1761 domain-containing protein [bacterium]